MYIPIPPAPTKPSTVPCLTLYSNMNMSWLRRSLLDSGITTWNSLSEWVSPIAIADSRGAFAMPSIASYCNLPRYPMVYKVIARIPGNGPKPSAIANRRAQMILGKLLNPARTILAGIAIGSGTKLLAASDAIGTEIMKPINVETNAILIVITIPVQAFEQNIS